MLDAPNSIDAHKQNELSLKDLQGERNQLNNHMAYLDTHFETEIFAALPEIERMLLRTQREQMAGLRNTLNRRIRLAKRSL